MSLGMELGLDLGDFVLDGDPVAPSPKGGGLPKFSAHVYCDQTTGWHGGRPQPRRVCVRWGPSPLPQKGQSPSPILRVEVESFEIGPEVGTLLVIATFVALEQQRILVKTRSESV